MHPFLTWVVSSLRVAAWAPLGVLVLHITATRGFQAYHRMPWLDIPFHFLGGLAIAYFFWRSLTIETAAPVLGNLTRLCNTLFVLAATAATTALWEFAEWVTDYLGWTGAQRGLDDTMLDMLMGLCGGVALVLMSGRRRSPRSR